MQRPHEGRNEPVKVREEDPIGADAQNEYAGQGRAPAEDVANARHSVLAPGWITDVFGRDRIADVSRLGWGFQNETWKVELTDDRRFAVTRIAAANAAASTILLTRLVQPRLVAAGIPAPSVVDIELAATAGILVTEFVEGTAGAELFDQRDGPSTIGSVLGSTWQKLARVDHSGLSLPAPWVRPKSVAWWRARLARVEPWLTRSERRQLSALIGTASDLLAGRQPGLVHGDLVPVNVVVRDGSLAALVDWESVRLADPLLDAAWFDWIAWFHHPAQEPAAWRAFVTASGLDDRDPTTQDLLRILPLMRLVEILEDDYRTDERTRRSIRMLRACLARAQ
jgi:aminoglycoside phosphotransferase (APT) family kinase protein